MKKVKVYIAGPYSNGDVMLNINKAISIGESLYKIGFTPFIPHLTGFWHMMFPHSYARWMIYDDEWLQVCDAVLRIPGESDGADAEVVRAGALGIPVFNTINELINYFGYKDNK